jgi:hypothetical protein
MNPEGDPVDGKVGPSTDEVIGHLVDAAKKGFITPPNQSGSWSDPNTDVMASLRKASDALSKQIGSGKIFALPADMQPTVASLLGPNGLGQPLNGIRSGRFTGPTPPANTPASGGMLSRAAGHRDWAEKMNSTETDYLINLLALLIEQVGGSIVLSKQEVEQLAIAPRRTLEVFEDPERGSITYRVDIEETQQ